MSEFFSNPATITIILTLFGMVLSYIKGTQWWAQKVTAQQGKAIDMIATGVTSIGQTYVDAAKAAAPDGKLTADQAAKARELAKAAAVSIGKAQGLDVLKTLGDDVVDHYIESAVANAKTSTPAPTTK